MTLRILLLNNYSMHRARLRHGQGLTAGQHLWGAAHLADFGIETLIPPYIDTARGGLHADVSRFFKGPFVRQQIAACAMAGSVDLIYSACQYNTRILAYLRSRNLLRIPLVALIHHPVHPLVVPGLVAGHDRLLFLTQSALESVRRLAPDQAGKLELIDWGADLEFYPTWKPPVASERIRIVCAGKSKRDHDTLARALQGLPVNAEIFCSDVSAPEAGSVDANTSVIITSPDQQKRSLQYHRDVIDAYVRSHIIAIPLQATPMLAGLTSLLDAMAMGRAVIMTRNAPLDIDVEREGFGITVEPGDVAGWRQAILSLLQDPDRVAAMGRRARERVESRYNLGRFTASLAAALKVAAGRDGQS